MTSPKPPASETSKGTSTEGHTSFRDLSGVVASQSGYEIKCEVYQHDKLGGKDGSCDGVAVEWLRMNLLDDAAGFRDTIREKFDYFGQVTSTINNEKARIKEDMNRNADAHTRKQAKWDKVVANQKVLEKRLSEASEVKVLEDLDKEWKEAHRKAKKTSESLEVLGDEARDLQGQLLSVYSKAVFGPAQGLALENAGQGDGNHIEADFKRCLNDPGYYLLFISKEGGTGGHTIGIQISDRPRFLDANSCEFEFKSREHFNNFLDYYWLAYRKSHRGGYHLYRYGAKKPPQTVLASLWSGTLGKLGF